MVWEGFPYRFSKLVLNVPTFSHAFLALALALSGDLT